MDCLKLENQLCFPLYACSKEVIRRYKPILDKLDLTYTQYITMMVLWSENEINVKDLGKKLYLDSGTLTPLLKKLEAKGLEVNTNVKIDYTSEVEKNKISKTSPAAGSKVKKGATITLYKSSGSDKVKIEDYTGQDSNKVQAKLELLGLNVIIEKKSIEKREDYVGKETLIIDQSIKEGELVVGDSISLYIPDMAERYPDFVAEGYTKAQVEDFCKQFGCQISRTNEQADNTKAPGTVLKQSRAAGSEVVQGQDLEITVSKLDEGKLEPLPTDDESSTN